jgi:hypothetical protein
LTEPTDHPPDPDDDGSDPDHDHAPGSPDPETEHLSELMFETLVAHLGADPELRPEDGVSLGVGALHATCRAYRPDPDGQAVQLELLLEGPPFGEITVLEVWGAVGPAPEEAVVQGVHDWTAGPLEVLLLAFGPPATRAPAPAQRALAGIAYHVFQSPIGLHGAAEVTAALGTIVDASSPAQRLMEAGVMPLLSSARSHVVSCYAAVIGDERLVEVRIDGALWAPGRRALDDFPWPPGIAFGSVRQSLVLTPVSPRAAHLTREGVESTLAGLQEDDAARRLFGARSHDYRLAPPLGEARVEEIERRAGVILPADYREFVATIGAAGAGPYHGLLPLDSRAQASAFAGDFAGQPDTPFGAADDDAGIDGTGEADDDVAGTLALAHLGCGYFSVLVVSGPARGSVWVDLRAAKAGLFPTHASFTDWYLDWLDHAVRGDVVLVDQVRGACSMPAALSSYFRGIEEREGQLDVPEAISRLDSGAIAISADTSNRYFDAGDPVDLCPWCVGLAENLGLEPDQIAPGQPPRAAR